MNEKEFLNTYDLDRYERPTGYTSDIVIFTLVKTDKIDEEAKANIRELQVLLIKRKEHPDKGKWALPGGFVNKGETAFEGAIRELEEETGVKDVYVKHFGVYDKYMRDPRGNGWVITNAHYAIVNEKYLQRRKAGDDAEEVRLFSVEEALEMDLAFDHNEIIKEANELVKKEMLETKLAKEFLDKEFLLSDLFMVLNSVTDLGIKKTNFFNKVKSLPFIEEVRDNEGNLKKTIEYSKRPAKLYRFNDVNKTASIY